MQVRRGGFPSRAAARTARDRTLAESREQHAGRTWTVARWLRHWLGTRTSIRPTTLRAYTHHVDAYLIPAIGRLRLTEVTTRHLTAMFAELAAAPTPTGRLKTPATLRRIRATLRAAYNAAIRDGMVADNPARRVEMPVARRPHAMVWAEGRVQQWRADGHRPAVAVWTTAQLTRFLDAVADDPLFALWWLIALRGLRRGEAAGLRWQDVDLDRRQLSIVTQRTTIGYQIIEGPPKSSASRRTIALDRHTVTILRSHQRAQRQTRRAADRLWRESGYVFTPPGRGTVAPEQPHQAAPVPDQDRRLPPVRLHDLRHGAASLAHTAGADLKTVQDQLGHASIVLTADNYTSVLPATQHKAAEATAAWSSQPPAACGTRSAAAAGPAARSDPRRSPPPARRRLRRTRRPAPQQSALRGPAGASGRNQPPSIHGPHQTDVGGKTAGQMVDRRLRHTNTLAVTSGPDLVLPVARERQVSRIVKSDAPGPWPNRSAR